MNSVSLQLIKNSLVRDRLAKFVALMCFRNTELEMLHTGIYPSTLKDYGDVMVKSPYGDIEWKHLSRLNDSEMKSLMIDVVEHTSSMLTLLFTTEHGDDLIKHLAIVDLVPDWDMPTGEPKESNRLFEKTEALAKVLEMYNKE